MSNFFNDSPIETPEDDLYGIIPFANAITNSISSIDNPRGTTLAINGPWGAGKSSAINLVRNSLMQREESQIEIIDFKCWWFRGEEALILAFLQQLNSALTLSLGDKVKDIVPEIGRQLLQAGPVIGAATALAGGSIIGSVFSKSADFAAKFFKINDHLDKLYSKLSKILADQDKRFLIIIDDIDRLAPDETLAVFRLVKSVGQLPNILYLLAYDRQLADKVVADRYPSEGPHFLEKIVQASFELPMPAQVDLDRVFLKQIGKICAEEPDERVVRFMNIFYDGIQPYLITPRHIARLINIVSVTWPALENEVNLPDFLALEALRLYEPIVYNRILTQKEFVLGKDAEKVLRKNVGDRADYFLDGVHEKKPHLRALLKRLFPALENTTYGNGFAASWDRDRLVCIEAHFDSYFQFSLSDQTISKPEIDKLIENAGNAKYVKATFLVKSTTIRRDGKSMIPSLFEVLNTHAEKVTPENVAPFIKAIFEIVGEIDRKEDNERGFGLGNTHLRVHWLIRRLTAKRFNLEQKTKLYLKATENASLDWLLDFYHSAYEDHNPRKGKEPTLEEDCLVTKDSIQKLNERTLAAIELAVEQDDFIENPKLASRLYSWLDLSDDGGKKINEWVSKKLRDEKNILLLTRAFTGETWSSTVGFDGLGDRVSKRSIHVKFDDDFVLFDLKDFRARIDKTINEAKLSQHDILELKIFLEAWNRNYDN